jgi:hypothetical protein
MTIQPQLGTRMEISKQPITLSHISRWLTTTPAEVLAAIVIPPLDNHLGGFPTNSSAAANVAHWKERSD